MLDKQEKRRAFLRRLKLYVIGVGIGVVISYFLLGRGRDFGVWTPNRRIFDALSTGKLVLSKKAACKLECLKLAESDVKALFDSTGVADINKRGKCPEYSITGDARTNMIVEVMYCDSTATVLDVDLISNKNGCLTCDSIK